MDIFGLLHGHYGWLIWALVALGVIWAWNGGIYRPSAHEGAYIKPAAPLDTGEAYGVYYAGTPTSNKNETLNLPEGPANFVREAEGIVTSLFAQSKAAAIIHSKTLAAHGIYIDGVGGARSEDPAKEYVRLVVDPLAQNPVQLSGLMLESPSMTAGIAIPRGSGLPILGTSGAPGDIILSRGDRAIITTGESPIGESFKVNECSGYLAQFQDYTPDLRRACPLPETELAAAGLGKDSTCAAFVENIPRCDVYRGALPENLSASCKTFVSERLTYNGCVATHRYDTDFYSNEWRVFLGQQSELWKGGNEIIELFDTRGNLLDALAF